MRSCLFLFAILAAPIGAVALSAPAAAKMGSTGAVVAACKRTQDCHYHSCGHGCARGCSPHACFDCNKGTCVGVTYRKGSRTPIKGGTLMHIMNAGARTTGGKAPPRPYHPVKVKTLKPHYTPHKKAFSKNHQITVVHMGHHSTAMHSEMHHSGGHK